MSRLTLEIKRHVRVKFVKLYFSWFFQRPREDYHRLIEEHAEK